jgi:hypothetical protein
MINVICLSSYLSIPTAHVTGLIARSSSAIADGDWDYLFLPGTVFSCFLLGSIVGGLSISHASFYLGKCPRKEDKRVSWVVNRDG